MATITGTTVSSGITLGNGTYTTSLTITSTGAVAPLSGDAIYGPGTQTWAVYNYGSVRGGNAGAGIDLRAGGTLANFGTIMGGTGGAGGSGAIGPKPGQGGSWHPNPSRNGREPAEPDSRGSSPAMTNEL